MLIMLVFIVPGIILGIYAQSKLSKNYNIYKDIEAECGLTASQLARLVLDNAGLQHIELRRERGTLTDHYHPQKEYIALSEDVYDSKSIASLGVALHEVGHAIQKKEHYAFFGLRQALVPLTNIASSLLWPLVFIGFLFGAFASTNSVVGLVFVGAGVGFYGIMLLFNLITLPVEYDASRRALKMLEGGNFLTETELVGAKKVLNSAALTYVASFVVSMLELFHFLFLIFLSRE